MRGHQRGTATVEFAVVGGLLLLVMLAVIEFGRALFVFTVLNEGTRRGARVATICPVNDPKIAQETIFAGLPGLTTDHVSLEYLNDDGLIVGDPVAAYLSIRYVRVRISDYEHRLIIPFVDLSPLTPEFATTLPRESLGVPREGVAPSCS